MNDVGLLDFLQSGRLLDMFIKLFGLVLGGLYVFFSVIMIRQVEVMGRTIRISNHGVLNFFAYLQLAFSIIILIYAIFLL